MNWTHIHSLAEEAALWTSLFLNTWIICTAISFAALKWLRRNDPNGKLLLLAIKWSLLAAGFFFGVAGIAGAAVGFLWLIGRA